MSILIRMTSEDAIEFEPLEEPQMLIREFKGEILINNFDYDNEDGTNEENDEYGEEIKIGFFSLHYVYASTAFNESIGLDEVFDAHSLELSFYFAELFQKDIHSEEFEYTDQLIKTSGLDYSNDDFIIIDRIEIVSKYRGKNIAPNLIKLLAHKFNTVSLFVIKPVPLQHEKGAFDVKDRWSERMALHELSADEESSFKKLENAYKKIGFKKLPKTELMVLNTVDGMKKIPPVKDDFF